MRGLRTFTLTLLISGAQTLCPAAAAAGPPREAAQATARLTGVVADITEARVPQAKIVLEGEGVTRTLASAEDGTYQVDLPPATYRVRVESPGFCPLRRAPFRLQPAGALALNFTLTPCPLGNQVTMKDGRYAGEVNRYLDPFKEEVFPVTSVPGPPLELFVRYGERRKAGNLIEYRGAVVGYDEQAANPAGFVRRDQYQGLTISYNALTIRAGEAHLDPETLRLKVKGDVVVEDGRETVRAKCAVIDLRSETPTVEVVR